MDEDLNTIEFQKEIITAISTIYSQIYSVDLRDNSYIVVVIRKGEPQWDSRRVDSASSLFEKAICKYVSDEYKKEVEEFLRLDTVADRMKDINTITMDYLAVDGKWYMNRFIVQEKDASGCVQKVLFAVCPINDQKQKELEYQRRLREATKAAERANEAKTNFLRRMSHDIRTPINGILGMIKIADRHRGDTEKLHECRRKVLGATEYLLSLVNNVLDMGKLETESVLLEEQPFDLIALLEKERTIIDMQASDNGVFYSGGHLLDGIVHKDLIGSPVHVNRIMMNIINNAIKYNRKGGTIDFSCRELSCDGDVAVYEFVCSDTGLGMSKEFQEHAFEPYAREGKESITSYSGSGIGLSIVKDIVKQMKGTIYLESEENVGTTFTVELPFKINHDVSHNKNPECRQKDVSGMKALLVEDNELNREIAQLMLEDEGLTVVTANNGQEALEQFSASKESEYDMIFMDVTMPVMDGLEATRQIRRLERKDAKTVHIIAMSANVFKDDIQNSIRAGMNSYLMKPLDTDKIKQAIFDAYSEE